MEGIKILLYHSVGKIDPEDNLGIRVDTDRFRSQMDFLKMNYKIWTLREAVDCIRKRGPIPQKTAVITFDDGYKDNIVNAAPIMERQGLRATFFVTVDYIGGIKRNPKRDWQRWECMGWTDLESLINRGHNIGSHSLHHIDLRGITEYERERELKVSKEQFGTSLNETVDLFSYPYGYFDEGLISVLKKEGYNAACTTVKGANDGSADLYRLRRIEITGRDTQDSFKKKLEGSYD